MYSKTSKLLPQKPLQQPRKQLRHIPIQLLPLNLERIVNVLRRPDRNLILAL